MLKKKKLISGTLIAAVLVVCCAVPTFAAEAEAEFSPSLYATFWALVPPIVAIVLALITKEVYSSLIIGIAIGGLLYTGTHHLNLFIPHVFKDAFVGSLTESDNIEILVFVTLLGIMVCLMTRAGGSAAFGRWAGQHIKTRVGAQLATVFLGFLIFIDDGFNCLTVGTVMRPVTDEHKISRAKLAYIIDSTAAPICIIAPISSWAAAVTGFVEGEDGFSLFIRAIPYNYYALLTIVMLIGITLIKVDFGPMRRHEQNALAGDLFTTEDRPYGDGTDADTESRGGVIDLLFPIIVLIGCCILGIVYTGGIFQGVPFIRAFSESEAALGLMLGTFFALIITILFYAVRKVLPLRESLGSCLPEGAKTMIPPMIILILAWTLKSITVDLGASVFVANAVGQASGSLFNFLPAIIFVVAIFLAFSTGTSWGTFGILIPIVVAVFAGNDETMLVLAISACMAGAVCGDHCSPISDTTIMSSAGAQCSHVNHVSTQLPYALTVACVSFVTYVIAGFVRTAWICLPIGVVLMLAVLLVMRRVARTRDHSSEAAAS